MSVLTIPRVIREHMGDDASGALAELINDVDIGARKDAIAIAEERFERRLVDELGKLRLEFRTEIGKINERITLEIGKINERITLEIGKVNERITEESGKLQLEIEKLRAETANTKAEIIKWMFLFWIGQTAVLIAIIKFLVVK
ncbi:MAG: DUF1640 domain-containing protein [Nitrospirae bacterium]|nr:DUF1640 domain-containing protein [Nitrospirota bacterium]